MTDPVRIEATGWGWRPAGREQFAVRGLDLVIEPGERVLLLGPSGAGKSTLLAGLAGVLGGDDEGEQEGALHIDGHSPASVRGRVGLVLQNPESQLVQARIGDDVAFGNENLGVDRDENWRRVEAALAAVGLGEFALDHPTQELSGGQQQRLALAGVLAMRPGALLLDEPTANLDPAGVASIRDAVIGSCAETGATLLVVEHRVAVWADWVDRVIVLDPGGGLLADGSPAEVFERHGARLAAAGVWVPGHEPSPERSRPRAPAPAPARLRADTLTVGRRRDTAALTGVDLTVRGGEILALTGQNGAGKSTLGLTLAGLLPALGGTVVSDQPDRAGSTEPARWKSKDLAARIGVVFQNPEHQFVAGTVREELALGPRLAGMRPNESEVRVRELAERLRLTALLEANPFTLSGGEQRRLSVATALGVAPAVLILDEPTFGQDALTWAELVRLLDAEAGRGTAVLAITHDEAFITACADRVVEVSAGALHERTGRRA